MMKKCCCKKETKIIRSSIAPSIRCCLCLILFSVSIVMVAVDAAASKEKIIRSVDGEVETMTTSKKEIFDNYNDDGDRDSRRGSLRRKSKVASSTVSSSLNQQQQLLQELTQQQNNKHGVDGKGLRNNNKFRRRRGVKNANNNNNIDNNNWNKNMPRESNNQRLLAVDPSVPKLTALVLLLQWKNHPTRNTVVPLENYEKLFNDNDGTDEYSYPVGNIGKYFQTMSYGQFEIEFIVADWYMTDFDQKYFTEDGSKGRGQNLQEAFKPALENLDSNGFDFGKVDGDGNKQIDLTVILHSGMDGIVSIDDCLTGEEAKDRVSSHAWTGASRADYSWESKDGYRLGPYAVASAFDGPHTKPYKGDPTPPDDCRIEKLARPGTILHEMIHTFGLPEMYDVENVGKLPNGQGGIDRFGIMANASGNTGGNLGYPGHMSAWTRLQFGWTKPIEITQDGTYRIRPVEKFPDIYVIKKGFANDKEYLLIENRQAFPGDFDERFFNPGGVLIYHVDENIWDEFPYKSGPKGQYPRGGPFLGESWPSNGKHYPVALLQADGKYELEQGINGGMDVQGVPTSKDIWNEPNQKISPKGTNGFMKYPNTDSYAFGEIKPTGITIQKFQLDPDGSKAMTFQVCGLDGTSDDCPQDVIEQPETDNDVVDEEENDDEQPTTDDDDMTEGEGDGEQPKPDNNEEWPIEPEIPVGNEICMIRSNEYYCDIMMVDVELKDECDCYNFCNGIELDCCIFGGDCPINCNGDFVGGCTAKPPTQVPTTSPKPPTQVPTTSLKPPKPEGQCSIQVNKQECPKYTSNQKVQEGCDCYNYCNGEFIGCGAYDSITALTKCKGELVAGCELSELDEKKECLLSVNTGECDALMGRGSLLSFPDEEDCDCYNFCDGNYYGCCGYNQFCGYNCQQKPSVLGCTVDNAISYTIMSSSNTKTSDSDGGEIIVN